MNFINVFDYFYWFSQPSVARGSEMWFWVIIFLVMILFGLVSKFIAQNVKEKYLSKIYLSFGTIGLSVGLVGLFWMFLRQERVPFLAWRFWLIIIFGVALWRLIVNIRFIVTRAPAIRKEQAEKNEKDKYLP